MLINERMQKILGGCAADLLNGTPPLHHQFLVENKVTADECMRASELLGALIVGVLVSPKQVCDTVYLAGTAADGKITQDTKANAAVIYGSIVRGEFDRSFAKGMKS